MKTMTTGTRVAATRLAVTRLAATVLLPAAALGLLLLHPPGAGIALAEGDSVRSVTGSTLNITPRTYVTGTTNVFSISAHNNSSDVEWLDGITVTWPTGWAVTGAAADTLDSCGFGVAFNTSSLGSNLIAFTDSDGGWGEVHGGCSWGAVITLTVPPSASSVLTASWLLSGDQYGGPPHTASGTESLVTRGANLAYLPTVFRDYGTKRYAVIVGVADYLNEDYAPDLNYTDNDAWDVRQALISHGGFDAANINILIDSQATKAGVHSAISSWLDSRENEDDLVVFFFSGHGANGGYLAPHDFNGYLSSAISDSELDTWLDGLESEQVVIGIDACYSGDFARGLGEGQAGFTCKCIPAPIDAPPSSREGGAIFQVGQPGRLVLTASTGEQGSWEFGGSMQNGAFSYYLVEALQTAGADTSSNGWVSGEEAYTYLAGRVDSYVYPRTGEHQNPQVDDDIPGQVDLTQP
jgi:hypothetical protein